MKYKAIIFDMDGTIIDTDHVWKKATDQLIQARGITLTPALRQELSHKLSGFALRESCTLIKHLLQFDDKVEDLIKEKLQNAQKLYKKQLNFIDGFEPFYQKICTYKLKVGLATNADDATLAFTRKKLKLERFFGNHLYNISFVNNRCKPDPAVYLYAAQQLQENPDQCIAIEDSAHGIQAAQQAGLFCIGLNSSKRIEQVQNAHMIVNHYDEIDLEKILSS